MTRLLRVSTEEERQQAMAELLAEHAYERIDKILASRFRQSSLPLDQRDDIRNEIVMRLVNRLSQLAVDPEKESIASFRDYVAVVAFNTFDDFMRRAFPLRTRLRNRIRYLLNHDPRLAIWHGSHTFVCGLAAWHGRPAAPRNGSSADAIVEVRADLSTTVFEVLHRLNEPISLEELVTLLAAAYHIPEHEEPRRIDAQRSAMTSRHPADEMENQQYLRALWEEICELPVRQRVALLLHARDAEGESVTRFLPVAGVASIHQISEILSIAASEFAELWNDLPLEDTKIAIMLQLSRQQVINLRRSARDRLERRMRARDQHNGKRQ